MRPKWRRYTRVSRRSLLLTATGQRRQQFFVWLQLFHSALQLVCCSSCTTLTKKKHSYGTSVRYQWRFFETIPPAAAEQPIWRAEGKWRAAACADPWESATHTKMFKTRKSENWKVKVRQRQFSPAFWGCFGSGPLDWFNGRPQAFGFVHLAGSVSTFLPIGAARGPSISLFISHSDIRLALSL